MYWYEKQAEEPSIVLSTRVRFARNLEDTPFPARLKEAERKEVFSRIKGVFEETDYMAVPFDDADSLLKEAYVETHLASRALADGRPGCGLILLNDQDVSLMVNEEDHVRLQVLNAGKSIRECFEKAIAAVTKLEEKLDFAYRDGLGYLTACPTNLGAAMRISVMIHLPALTAAGAMGTLIGRLNQAGYTVRGLFGEGSRESGSIYQISNQMSREKGPKKIEEDFTRVIGEVEEQERIMREKLILREGIALEDRVSRALGTLKYAKKMSYGEFIGLYSAVRFGKEAGILEEKGLKELDRLMIELMPAPMILRDRSLTDEGERDRKRCEILRERLK